MKSMEPVRMVEITIGTIVERRGGKLDGRRIRHARFYVTGVAEHRQTREAHGISISNGPDETWQWPISEPHTTTADFGLTVIGYADSLDAAQENTTDPARAGAAQQETAADVQPGEVDRIRRLLARLDNQYGPGRSWRMYSEHGDDDQATTNEEPCTQAVVTADSGNPFEIGQRYVALFETNQPEWVAAFFHSAPEIIRVLLAEHAHLTAKAAR